MIRFLLKIFLFSGFFLFGLKCVDNLFIVKNDYSFSREKYENINKNIDIAIFGSSHAYRTFDPRIFEVQLGLNTYNFGSSSQHLITTEAVMDDVLSNNNVKLAIIDVYGLALQKIGEKDEKRRSFQLNVFDNLDFSFSKLSAYKKQFGLREFYNLSPTIRNHGNWNKIFAKRHPSINKNEDFYNGFHTDFRFNKKRWDFSIKKNNQNKRRNIVIKQLTIEQQQNIDAIIDKAKEFNVPIILACAPFHKEIGKRATSYQELVKKYLDSKEVEYLDYNLLWKEIGLNKFDFKDLDHLNARGALKVSTHISNYINKNFTLKNVEGHNKDFLSNRYAIVGSNNVEVLLEKALTNSIVKAKFGIEKIYLFKAYNNTFELLIEGENDKLKSLNTCFYYETNSGSSNENKKIKDCNWINGAFKYNNKQYLCQQFSIFNDDIENIRLLIGPDKDIQVLHINKLKLN